MFHQDNSGHAASVVAQGSRIWPVARTSRDREVPVAVKNAKQPEVPMPPIAGARLVRGIRGGSDW